MTLDLTWHDAVRDACEPVFVSADVGFVWSGGRFDSVRPTFLWEANPERFAAHYPDSGIERRYGDPLTPPCIDYWVHVDPATMVARLSVEGWNAPWWWHDMPWVHKSTLPPGVAGFSGGCDAFQVFAQNRWDPVGTVVRASPNITANRVGSFAPNYSITVNGWVHSRPAYPTNTAPWNSDVWYHVADNSGWVSFPGVRANPTARDPSGLSKDGGPPAATSKRCEGSIQSECSRRMKPLG